MSVASSPILVGVATPQANPTVEAEFRQLLPDTVNMQVSRLTSQSADSATRLRDYLEQLGTTIGQYGGMPLAVLGFACTSSTYLLGRPRQQELLMALPVNYPVITACDAIGEELRLLRAQRIGLVMPYPERLAASAVAYWESAGLVVARTLRVDIGTDDTRLIYALGNADTAAALEQLDMSGLDAVVVTGTGMPSLSAISSAAAQSAVPIFSSNMALVRALLRAVQAGNSMTDLDHGH